MLVAQADCNIQIGHCRVPDRAGIAAGMVRRRRGRTTPPRCSPVKRSSMSDFFIGRDVPPRT